MTQKRNFRKVAQQLKKRTMLAIIAMLIVGTVSAQKPKLAVMDFMAGVGLYQNDVNGLSDMLINSLFNTGRFELIERGQLCELIGETNLQKSSLSAGQLQQLAIKGVNFLLLGRVNLTGGEFNIDVRVVDVGTGQLYSTAGVTKLSGQTYRDMMPKLANELATKLPQTVNATLTVVTVPEKPKSTSVVTLLGYLQVYPDDIGTFSSVPTNIIENINRQKLYGYNDWRLPTQEELDLIKANSSKLGLKNGDYMTAAGRSGNVRLVSTGKSAAEQQAEQRVNGVKINGVVWATRNVATPGTFAAKPEDAGMFYQWNRKTAWEATGSVSSWEDSKPAGNSWEKANDPSPAGWRVPTINEIETLFDTDKVSNVWTTQNGVSGSKFADKATGNSIFLPAAGYRSNSSGTLSFVGSSGYYWSSMQSIQQYGNADARSLSFGSGYVNTSNYGGSYGFSVRCVAE